MATTFTPNLRLGVPGPNDRGWGDVVARDLALLDALAPVAGLHARPAEHPSTSLSVVVSPGRFRRADGSPGAYAGGSIALPPSATRSLHLDASGALQATASQPVGWRVPIATVVTGASSVTSVVDDRVAAQALGAGSGGQLGGLVVAPTEAPSATLSVSVSAGRHLKPDGSAGSYAGTASRTLPASTTTVLYLDASGALQSAPSYPAAAIVPIATVVTGASSVTSVVDDRVAVVATAPPGGASHLPLAGGTMADAAVIAAGTPSGLKIAGTSSQKLGFYGAAPVARPGAYSAGYAPSSRALPSYAPVSPPSFSGLASGAAGVPYAGVADLNALRAACENLRDFVESLAARQNAIVNDLKALGLVG